MNEDKRKDLYEEMEKSHDRWKEKWRKAGCPGDFYSWMLGEIEEKMGIKIAC